MADVIARHKEGKSILYYTWTPYYISALLVPNRKSAVGSGTPAWRSAVE